MISKGKFAQYFIILIIVAVSLVLAAGLWKRNLRQVRQEALQTSSADPEMKLKDMEFTEMQEGKRIWTLHASEAKYYQDEQQTRLLAVHLTFYLDKPDEQVYIDSREGVLHAGTKDIDLKGDVKMTLPHEYVLTTETAHYTHSDRIIDSADPVHMSGPGLELDGGRWKYRISDHIANVDGKVTASLVVNELRVDK